jgi:hypothetical protein
MQRVDDAHDKIVGLRSRSAGGVQGVRLRLEICFESAEASGDLFPQFTEIVARFFDGGFEPRNFLGRCAAPHSTLRQERHAPAEMVDIFP